MRIPGLKAAKLARAWLRSWTTDSALILAYHRVTQPVADPFHMCVTAERFEEQLEAIRHRAEPLKLGALADGIRAGAVPANAVAITFDDGYADLLDVAVPALERYGIPATVFVTTGFIGQEFWWDSLERLLLWPDALPNGLCEVLHTGQVGGGNVFSLPPPRIPLSRLQAPAGPKLAFTRLYDWLRKLDHDERSAALRGLWRLSASVAVREEPPPARAMTADELAALARSELIELGAHTVSHPLLDRLSADDARRELNGSKARLEEISGQRVTGFSLPHGSAFPGLTELMREVGFAYACGSRIDVVWRRSDPYDLPRLWPGNWGRERFSRWLRMLTGHRRRRKAPTPGALP